jgi:WD40 repeat protein/Flp pilus assembly protein TadD
MADVAVEAGGYDYAAFISYRHVNPDRALAIWLQTKMETYRPPGKLVRARGQPRRSLRIFRDEEELSATSDLSREIDSALRRSEFLIVVCSPRTPESRWVNEEVTRFRKMGRHDRILALLIEGEPREAFPESLREIRGGLLVGDAGSELGQEPLAADVRPSKLESQRMRKRMAKLRLLAPILGCRFDDLRQRDAERRRRRFLQVGLVAAILLFAVLTATIFGFYEQSQAARMKALRDEADKQRGIAEEQRKLNRHFQYAAQMNLAQKALETKQMPLLVNLLEAQKPKKDDEADLRGFEWYYLWRLAHAELLNLSGHTDDVYKAVFSPDGTRLASCGGTDDKTVREWDARTGQQLHCLRGHGHAVFSVAYSPDGKRIASASADQTVKLWDAADGRELLTLRGHKKMVRDVTFSPDGRYLASGGEDDVSIWDPASGHEIRTLKVVGASVAFSPDGRWLASGGKGVTVWEVATGTEIRTLQGDEFGGSLDVAFSPDGRYLASAEGMVGTIRLWDVATGKELYKVQAHTNSARAVTFSPDGRWLVSGGYDRMIRIWDAKTGKKLGDIAGHTNYVTSVKFSPDGSRLASAGADSQVKVWDMTGAAYRQPRRVLNGHKGIVFAVAFSPNGKRLASAGADRTVKVWDPVTSERLVALEGHTDSVVGVVFSPDGGLIATASLDKTAKLWDARTGKVLRTLPATAGVNSVAFSADGQWLASANEDNLVRLWDVSSGKLIRKFEGHADPVVSVAFSRDGIHLASSSWDRHVKVWDLKAGREIYTLEGHRGTVTRVAFSPDGKLLASSSLDGAIKVWDVATGKELQELQGHTGQIQGVTFSPDGQRLASACLDNTVRLWDATLGQELLVLEPEAGFALDVTFSPNGKRLASSQGDGTVRVWDVERHPDVMEKEWQAWPRQQAAACEEAGQWFGAAFRLSRLIEASPNDETLYARRGDAYAELGQWENAVADFSRAHTMRPDDAWIWLDLGLAQLGRGDTTGSRRTCKQLLDRFAKTEDADTAFSVVMLCLLLPDSVPEGTTLTELAKRASEGKERRQELLGMALYRTGQFNEAAEALARIPQGKDQKTPVLNQLFLSMAYHKLGNTEEARRLFAQAVEQMEAGRLSGTGDAKAKRLDWGNRLRRQVLRQEVYKMLKRS